MKHASAPPDSPDSSNSFTPMTAFGTLCENVPRSTSRSELDVKHQDNEICKPAEYINTKTHTIYNPTHEAEAPPLNERATSTLSSTPNLLARHIKLLIPLPLSQVYQTTTRCPPRQDLHPLRPPAATAEAPNRTLHTPHRQRSPSSPPHLQSQVVLLLRPPVQTETDRLES